MIFRVVTTMNLAGWEQFGKRMVESFLEKWPAECLPLVLYAEGFDPPALPGLEVRRLPTWMQKFKADHATVPARTGHIGAGYDYRQDAVKFAHKVAALTDFALGLVDGECAIWLDADTFTHSHVTTAWLESLFPGDGGYIAWLDRVNSHPECGFVMFKTAHSYHRNFMEGFRTLYATGRVFDLPETHDSYVLWHLVVRKCATMKIPTPVSLSGDKRWHHPFVNGPLGDCMDHMKGPRKAEGRSRAIDIRIPRNEPYWKVLR